MRILGIIQFLVSITMPTKLVLYTVRCGGYQHTIVVPNFRDIVILVLNVLAKTRGIILISHLAMEINLEHLCHQKHILFRHCVACVSSKIQIVEKHQMRNCAILISPKNPYRHLLMLIFQSCH